MAPLMVPYLACTTAHMLYLAHHMCLTATDLPLMQARQTDLFTLKPAQSHPLLPAVVAAGAGAMGIGAAAAGQMLFHEAFGHGGSAAKGKVRVP